MSVLRYRDEHRSDHREVEAMQVRSFADLQPVATWLLDEHGGSCTSPTAVLHGMEGAFRIQTPGGVEEVRVGDYVVWCEGYGSYPCRPDVFERTYAQVTR